MLTTIIFDLDGTLLPMEQEEFLKYYFILLTRKFSAYKPELLIKAVNHGVKAMFENDGKQTNEVIFWKKFSEVFPVDENTERDFADFYNNEFLALQKHTPTDHDVKEIIDILKRKNYRLVCCTNPVFPAVATYNRLKWAGLSSDDFSEITTYENSHYCKPKLQYYEEVLNRLKLNPEECLMVGNDVDEDMCTKDLGMKTYLVTNHLINRSNKAHNADYSGSRQDLLKFVEKIKLLI